MTNCLLLNRPSRLSCKGWVSSDPHEALDPATRWYCFFNFNVLVHFRQHAQEAAVFRAFSPFFICYILLLFRSCSLAAAQGHVFCFFCIHKWSKITNKCPTCRLEFTKITKTLSLEDTLKEAARREVCSWVFTDNIFFSMICQWNSGFSMALLMVEECSQCFLLCCNLACCQSKNHVETCRFRDGTLVSLCMLSEQAFSQYQSPIDLTGP